MLRSKRRQFEAMVRACSGELYRYGYWLTRDPVLAEDLVQETFTRAWASWDRLRDDRAARAWLYTILRNEHARLYERKRIDLADEPDLDAIADPGHRDMFSELELNEALHELPAGYREPLLLQVLGGFSCDEIAQMMHLTVGAVMTRLSRARMELRRLYSADHGKKEDSA